MPCRSGVRGEQADGVPGVGRGAAAGGGAVRQLVAHANGDRGGGAYTYVTDLREPVEWYEGRAYVGRGLARSVNRYVAQCPRCKWALHGFQKRSEATAAFKRHHAERHAGESERMRATHQVTGHCIRHAGARYTERVDRLLRPDGPEEPVYHVSDGLEERVRLPWRVGYVTFETNRLAFPVRCPEHDEPLRFWEVVLVALDGRPAHWFTASTDMVAQEVGR